MNHLAFLTSNIVTNDEGATGDVDISGAGVPGMSASAARDLEAKEDVSTEDDSQSELPSGWTRVMGQRGNGDEYLRHYLGPWNNRRRKMCKTLADVHIFVSQGDDGTDIKTESIKHIVTTAKDVLVGQVEESIDLEDKVEQPQDNGAVEDEVERVDDEDVEVEEVTICGDTYYTDDAVTGTIYACLQDSTVGDEVGHFEDGHAFFS